MIICGRYGRDVEREGNIHVLDEQIVEGERKGRERRKGREKREGGRGKKRGHMLTCTFVCLRSYIATCPDRAPTASLLFL